MRDDRVSLEGRLVRAARGTATFATLGDDELRAVVRDYLAQQEGFAGRALERLLDRNTNQFREVYELHRRQSTFEGDVAAWQRAHE